MASNVAAVFAIPVRNDGDRLSKALDILEAFVGYFDGKAPLAQRAQLATKALAEARKLLSPHGNV